MMLYLEPSLWWIGTIIGIVTLLIGVAVFFLLDLDIEDIAWLAYIAIPLLLSVGISGITGWISTNWVGLCIVGGGIIGDLIIIGIVALIMWMIDEFCWDVEPIYVVLTVIGIIILGGIVCGFVFWKWWAMFIVVCSMGAIVGLIVLIKHLLSGRSIKSLKQEDLEKMTVEDLRSYCSMYGIRGYSKLKKPELVELLNNYIKDPTSVNNSLVDSTVSSNNKTNDEKRHTQTLKTVSPKKHNGKITFDSIAGLEKVKETFREKVILPFEHPEIFEKFSKKAGGGILLYGLPGTGKTMFAEAASNELDAKFISIKCSDIKSKWYGESEQKVRAIFKEAKKYEKAIIFFDEFEAIGAKRTDDSNNGNNDLVPEILAEMQGVGSSKSDSTIMIIAATNKPWAIDSAFMRPGRFDEKIYIPLPDFAARKALFSIQLKKLPVADDLDYDYLAKITEGFNGADIKEFCEKLKMSAIKDSLSKGEEQTIGMDDVQRVEGTVKSSVSLEDIEQLKNFESEN